MSDFWTAFLAGFIAFPLTAIFMLGVYMFLPDRHIERNK